jgi:membrane-anchored glycerophosphoryl diester phosphodiesterase (GDPDase)
MRERGFLAAWRFYRTHFAAVFTLSAAFYAGMVAVAAASVAAFGWFAVLALFYLMLASIFWQQAPLARLMDDVRAQRPHPGVRRTFEALYPRLGSITGGSAVAAIAVFTASAFFLLPGLIVLTRLALFVPVIVLEGCGAFAAFGRSHRLLRRHAPRVFLELCMSTVLMIVIWSIAWTLLTATTLWVSVPLVIAFLALVTPPVPLMRVLSYYDLVEAEAKEAAAALGIAVPVG